MIVKITQPDGSFSWVETNYIQWFNGSGLILSCGKTLPLTPDMAEYLAERLGWQQDVGVDGNCNKDSS